MPYTYADRNQAADHLSQRLYDSPAKFYAADEARAYITEAMRTWNAFTNFQREEFHVPLVVDTIWYDITDPAVAPDTKRAVLVTDEDIYKNIQRSLLEPSTGSTWSGSSQYSADDMVQAVARRRSEIIGSSCCTVTRQLIATVPGRIYLPDECIDIRRIAWLPVAGFGYTNSPLWPDDSFSLQSYETLYPITDPGTPSSYRRSAEPPLAFDVNINPAVPGQYEVLSSNSGTGIPDDFSWLIKCGALADMLGRDSLARDTARHQYCNIRFKQGMALLYNASAVIGAKLNGLPLHIESVQDADNYRPGWQAETHATPDTLVTAGLNLVGLVPKPDAEHLFVVSVVENAPVSDTNNYSIQLSRDDYDAVLDYAQHLAMFKVGGQEFMATIPLLQRFVARASLYNSKLAELGSYMKDMYELSRRQLEAVPVYSTVDPQTQSEEV